MFTAALLGAITLPLAFNNCSSPIGSPATGTFSSLGNPNCPAKVGPSPFANQKILRDQSHTFVAGRTKIVRTKTASPESELKYVAVTDSKCVRESVSPKGLQNLNSKVFTASTEDSLVFAADLLSPEQVDALDEADPCLIGVSPNLTYRLNLSSGQITDQSEQEYLGKMNFNPSIDSFYGPGGIPESGTSALVAVIDTGADYNHPDLSANMHRGPNGIGFEATPRTLNTPPVYDGMDMDIHGTHVSGFVAGFGGNGVGITGIAPRGVKIIPIKVFYLDSNRRVSSDTQSVIRGMDFALSQNADVINMSLGIEAYDPAYLSAIQRVVASGVFVAVAAGNGGFSISMNRPDSPAMFGGQISGMLTVGSVDAATDQRSPFSNFNPAVVEITAYGSHLGKPRGLGGMGHPNGVYSTVPGSGYDWLPGTSMSSPQVAAAGALVKALGRVRGRNFTPSQIEDLIVRSARKDPALTTAFREGSVLDLASLATLTRNELNPNTPTPSPNPTPTPTPPNNNPQAPVMTQFPPPRIELRSGQTLQINVGVTGAGLTYQWSLRGQVVARTQNYTKSQVSAADAGVYMFRATNSFGSVEQAVQVVIDSVANPPPPPGCP
jgi:hypothetical protein